MIGEIIMNRAQRRVLVVGFLVIAASLLFPPFDFRGYGHNSSWEYCFLWRADLVPSIYYGLLFLQDLVILAITIAVFLLNGGGKE